MKKVLLSIAAALFISFTIFGQAKINETGFAFQGYARDADGKALGNASINVQFIIYPEGAQGSPVMTEVHTKTTDAFGVFSAEVGSVSTADFKAIDFTKADYWLKVDTKLTAAASYAEISNTQLMAVAYAKAAGNGTLPGTIISWAGATVPAGYLICDGASYNTADYPALHAAIGTIWGTDGAKFRVPDLRGQFLRGFSGASNTDPDKATRVSVDGSASGNNVGSYQADQTRAHNHNSGTLTGVTNTTGAHTHDIITKNANVSGNGGTGADWAFEKTTQTSSNGDHSHTVTINGGATANSGGSETRPKNAYVYFIIKY